MNNDDKDIKSLRREVQGTLESLLNEYDDDGDFDEKLEDFSDIDTDESILDGETDLESDLETDDEIGDISDVSDLDDNVAKDNFNDLLLKNKTSINQQQKDDDDLRLKQKDKDDLRQKQKDEDDIRKQKASLRKKKLEKKEQLEKLRLAKIKEKRDEELRLEKKKKNDEKLRKEKRDEKLREEKREEKIKQDDLKIENDKNNVTIIAKNNQDPLYSIIKNVLDLNLKKPNYKPQEPPQDQIEALNRADRRQSEIERDEKLKLEREKQDRETREYNARNNSPSTNTDDRSSISNSLPSTIGENSPIINYSPIIADSPLIPGNQDDGDDDVPDLPSDDDIPDLPSDGDDKKPEEKTNFSKINKVTGKFAVLSQQGPQRINSKGPTFTKKEEEVEEVITRTKPLILEEPIEKLALIITMVEAYNIAAKDRVSGKSDPYAQIKFGKKKFKTTVKRHTCFPFWGEQFVLKNLKDLSHNLIVNIWDKDLLIKRDFCGCLELPLDWLYKKNLLEGWFPLLNKKKVKRMQGSVYIRIEMMKKSVYKDLEENQEYQTSTGNKLVVQNKVPKEDLLIRDKIPLKIYIGTWNLANSSPPQEIPKFIPSGSFAKDYDIISICTQEAGNTKTDDWKQFVKRHVGPNFARVAYVNGNGLKSCVFVKRDLVPLVSRIKHVTEACGVHVNDKGGILIGISIANTHIALLNVALPYYEGNLRSHPLRELYKKLKKNMLIFDQHMDFSNQYDYLFMSGDIGSRMIINPKDATKVDRSELKILLNHIKLKEFDKIEQYDQLGIEQKENGFLTEFKEKQLTFRPTYKLGKNKMYDFATDVYPCWTDRILYTAKKGNPITAEEYDSVHSITSSNHAPVYARMQIQARQLAPLLDFTMSPCTLKFLGLEVSELTNLKEQPPDPFLRFVSPVLVEEIKTPSLSGDKRSKRRMKWDTSLLPPYILSSNNFARLQQTGLFIHLCSTSGTPRVGQGFLSWHDLRRTKLVGVGFLGHKSRSFRTECTITKAGIAIGKLYCHLELSWKSTKKKKKKA